MSTRGWVVLITAGAVVIALGFVLQWRIHEYRMRTMPHHWYLFESARAPYGPNRAGAVGPFHDEHACRQYMAANNGSGVPIRSTQICVLVAGSFDGLENGLKELVARHS
jgi:hypothetical protein